MSLAIQWQVEKKIVHRIEAENRRLSKQIRDMEQFLADYGLKWVGADEEADEESQRGAHPPGNNSTKLHTCLRSVEHSNDSR